MRKKSFCYFLCCGIAIWVLSIPILYFCFGWPANAAEFGGMFGAVNALFSGLALAGVIYTVLIQTADIQNNQKQNEERLKANEKAILLTAYSALLNDCENSHERYERWEKSERSGDYSKAKKSVREKINFYRKEIELLVADIKNSNNETAAISDADQQETDISSA